MEHKEIENSLVLPATEPLNDINSPLFRFECFLYRLSIYARAIPKFVVGLPKEIYLNFKDRKK